MGILLAVVVLIISGPWLAYWLLTSSMKSDWESQLTAQLTATDSYTELSNSLSGLGAMLGEEQGNWIAIDYRDTHAGIIASKAVARMKDGTLLVGDEHFCGRFAVYSNLKQMWQSEQENATEAEQWSFREYCTELGTAEMVELEALESTQDPELQQELLLKLGFNLLD
ncbi:MAG: hypothetical protein KDA29_00795 [Phycisphaerales bacterium]|nr:hypothetical protein [Phycisphaerales bacterium]